jgi:hypothetical protein
MHLTKRVEDSLRVAVSDACARTREDVIFLDVAATWSHEDAIDARHVDSLTAASTASRRDIASG